MAAKATSGDAALDRWTRRLALDLFMDTAGVRGLAEVWLVSTQDAMVGRHATPVGSLACLVRHLSTLDAKKRLHKKVCDLSMVAFQTPTPTVIISLFGREHTELALSPLALQQTLRWRALRVLAVLCDACGVAGAAASALAPFLLFNQEGMRGELITSEFRANAVLDELFEPRLFLLHVAHLFVITLIRFHPVGLPEALVADARVEALAAAIAVFEAVDGVSEGFAVMLAQVKLLFAQHHRSCVDLERSLANQIEGLRKRVLKWGVTVLTQLHSPAAISRLPAAAPPLSWLSDAPRLAASAYPPTSARPAIVGTEDEDPMDLDT